MNDAHAVCTVVLAAGTAKRYGSLKQLQELDGQSLIRRAAKTALATGTAVGIVTGAEAERVHAELADLPLRLIHNAQWQRGMGHSLACAVTELERTEIEALLILLADQPLIRVQDLHKILSEHDAHPDAIIAADHGNGVLGPPCLFPARCFAELKLLDGDRGARALIQQHREAVRCVEMPHASMDIDTPEDLARALEFSKVRSP